MKKTGQYAKVSMTVSGTEVPVMELREWTISGSTEKIDANVAGTEWASHVIGRASWEGEATCISADQYWLDMLFDFVTVSFYDHKDDLEPVYTGECSIDFERGVPHDDMIESTITFTGNNALTSPKGAAAPATGV